MIKKIKIWYIKLAFAALFFALLAESQVYSSQKHEAASEIETSKAPLVTSRLVEAIAVKNAEAASLEAELLKAQSQSKFILVKGKPYTYKLAIPKIKVSAGVLGMGLTPDGKMAVPDNYTEVGWYNLGTKPGAIGSAVLGAHVDNGGTIRGVFKDLKKLKVGDMIYVSDGNGTEYKYKVSARTIYSYRNPATEEIFSKNDKERLNLITCYGTWLPKENTYNQRLVVSAVLQKTSVASR
ncbi:MAG: srtA [Candidatus Paceibacter sp.]|jgi:LPXTG-site transpeptidase (sortase) family protein|nr:srtA [Candidatus Paceibacter sp.]